MRLCASHDACFEEIQECHRSLSQECALFFISGSLSSRASSVLPINHAWQSDLVFAGPVEQLVAGPVEQLGWAGAAAVTAPLLSGPRGESSTLGHRSGTRFECGPVRISLFFFFLKKKLFDSKHNRATPLI